MTICALLVGIGTLLFPGNTKKECVNGFGQWFVFESSTAAKNYLDDYNLTFSTNQARIVCGTELETVKNFGYIELKERKK